MDVTQADACLPKADGLIANLFIEYIGYQQFQSVIQQVQPTLVSCIIQVNFEEGFVSNSPYLHVFDHLDEVYHKIDVDGVVQCMQAIGYVAMKQKSRALPNHKQLIQLDFKKG